MVEEEKVLVKQEEKVDEEKKPKEEKEEEEDKVAGLLKKTRELLAEFNEAVNELARALESVDKKLEEKFAGIEKKLDEIKKKLVIVEEVSARKDKEKYGAPKEPTIPTKDGKKIEVTAQDLQRLVSGEFLQKEKVETAETPRPEDVNKGEFDDIVEKIMKGEASLEGLGSLRRRLVKDVGELDAMRAEGIIATSWPKIIGV